MTFADDKRFHTKRSFGQNFLSDTAVASRIVAAVDVSPGDEVIEIGPGNGALTGPLLAAGARVIAIEADKRLVPVLRGKFGDFPGFELHSADALKVDFSTIASNQPVKLVANLPYNISTAILRKIAAERSAFSMLVLMFQREVVERISAPPGNSNRGFLTVLSERSFEIDWLFDVPAAAFRPRPKITSSVVRLTPKLPVREDEERFRRFISAAFRQKRKTLANNLKSVLQDAEAILGAASIDPRRRAETLSLEEWETLFELATDALH